MLLNIILSVSYAIEIVKGLRTAGYYIIFMLVCWIPFAVGLILLKIKGRAAQYYKDVVVIGYGILYVLFSLPHILPWHSSTYYRLPVC